MSAYSPYCPRFLPLSLLTCLLLSGCQHPTSTPTPEEQPPIPFRHTLIETQAEHCQGQPQCPLVNIETLHAPNEPQLNQLVDIHLRAMTLDHPKQPMPSSLVSYQKQFLATAKPGWSTWLQAKLIDWHHHLLIIELSSYLQREGSQGLPGRGFINYDRINDRPVQLKDRLLPGQESAFWNQVKEAHQRWLQSHNQDNASFRQRWPFRTTDNIAFLRDRVLLKYPVAWIAPYDSGHPELSIPYTKLQGILRPW